MKLTHPLLALGFAAMTCSLLGCQDASKTVTSVSPAATVDDRDDHAHPTEGPHHGDLIELGNEEYHGELVHDEAAGSVAIYVLDSAATSQVPIESTEITINLKHDGQPKQFKLAAAPDSSDPDGRSSRFVSTDAELSELLHDEAADAKLVLTIQGKSFRGAIDHDHDH